MLQLVNPKQLDKYLNDPATMGKVSPEAPAGIPEIINAKKKEMTEDRSTMVGDLIGTARRIKKVDDDIMNYKKTITNEMIGRGIDPETAAEMAENLAEMVAKDAAAVGVYVACLLRRGSISPRPRGGGCPPGLLAGAQNTPKKKT